MNKICAELTQHFASKWKETILSRIWQRHTQGSGYEAKDMDAQDTDLHSLAQSDSLEIDIESALCLR